MVLGENEERIGDNGAARREERMEPRVVRDVRSRVAGSEPKSEPARTLRRTAPGIDHACFHTARRDSTDRMWRAGRGPEAM